MINYGIFFRTWLHGSTAQIRVSGQYSNVFPISRSIKQGGILSTFYFVAFYNDIHAYVREGNTQSLTIHGHDMGSPTMADDTLLLASSVFGLQTMIDNANDYAKRWRFEYSQTKTKCITFGESKQKQSINKMRRQWRLGDVLLEEVDSYNYLGIILAADGSSHLRIKTMSKKGYSSFGMLKSAGFHSKGLSPITCSRIWKRMITPSMLYGCEIWGNLLRKEINILELVQKKIGKYIQGLHPRTHDEIVRGLLGWYTLEGTIDSCKLNFVHKLMSLHPENVIKQIFLAQMYSVIIAGTNTSNISCDLWSVLGKYGINQFLFQNTCIYYIVFTGIHVYILKYYYTYISKKPI